MEEVFVTARKRPETLASLPLQADVFDREAISSASINDLDDYVALSPSLQRVRNGNDTETLLVIRGLGNYGVGESSVGYFVDGGYQVAGSLAAAQLFDIERIEVLHGPQDTLYGKSTTAGAISVTTRQPQFDDQAELGAELASDERYRASGAFNRELVAGIAAARLAFSYEDFGGFFRNVHLDEPVDDHRRLGLRGSLLLQPTPALTVRPTVYALDRAQHGFSLRRTSAPDDFEGEPFARDVSNDFDVKAWGGTLAIDYQLGDLEVAALTTVNRNEEAFVVDLDYRPVPLFYAAREFERRDVSQELRLTSSPDAPVRWQAGVYYFALRGEFDQRIFAGGPRGVPLSLQRSVSHATTWSAFARSDIDIAPALTLGGGVRYDYDIRTQALAGLSRRNSWANVSGNLNLAWRLPSATAYLGVHRMFRPGGFNDGGLPGFGEEMTTVYEAGVHGRVGNRLRYTAAVFNNRVKNAQNLDLDFNSITEVTTNKGRNEILGVEGRLRWRVLNGLDVDLAATWLDHRYANYRARRFGPAGPTTYDFSGNALQWVADYQVVTALDYRRPLSVTGRALDGRVRLVARFTGPQAWDDFNTAFAPSREVVDLSVGVAGGSAWSVDVFVDNLFDEAYFTNYVPAYAFPFAASDLGAPAAPRQGGLRLRWQL